MRPIITDPAGTRRLETPRIVEVQRQQGRRHQVVMPERPSWRQRLRTPLRLLAALLLIGALAGAATWWLR